MNLRKIINIRRILILKLLRYGKKASCYSFTYQAMRGVYRLLMGKGVLLHLKFDITQRCNRSCSFCYSRHSSLEASYSEISNFFRCLKGRVYRIDLMGGEPMLHKDIYPIIAAAKEKAKAICVSMFTNGTLIDRESARRLKDSGLDLAFVSFFSDDAKMQDGVSGKAGSYEGKIRAMKELSGCGVITYSFTVLNKDNHRRIESIDRLVRSLGARSVFFNQIPVNKAVLEKQLSSQEIYETKKALRDLDSKHMKNVSNMFRFTGHTCFGGYFMLSVKSDGKVTHCPFVHDVPLGNAFKENIFKIFAKRMKNGTFKKIYGIPEECGSCSLKAYCRGGCKSGNKASLGGYGHKMRDCAGPWNGSGEEIIENCIPYWF